MGGVRGSTGWEREMEMCLDQRQDGLRAGSGINEGGAGSVRDVEGRALGCGSVAGRWVRRGHQG